MGIKYFFNRLFNFNAKKGYIVIVMILVIFCIAGCFSLAYLTSSAERKGALNITAGNLHSMITSAELDNNLTIQVQNNETKSLTIKLSNINNIDAKFLLYYMTEQNNGVLPTGLIVRYESGTTPPPDYNGTVISKEGSLTDSRTYNIVIRNKSGTTVNIKFGAVVGLSDKAITLGENKKLILDEMSNINSPHLSNNMIPIKWNGSRWVKANKKNQNKDWYDYDSKIWANAVTVTEATRSYYQSASEGTTILESDILTYMVWIPRYSYAINSSSIGTNNPSEIQIVFEFETETTGTGNAIDNNLYIHPAFTFGDKELTGFWVGKFETSGDINNLTIKPNSTSIRNQTISTMFHSALAMKNEGNVYGYPTNVDTHMMKNIEWGAVSYLAHSKYGQNTEITINNSSTYTTGCAGNTVSASSFSGCQNQYQTNQGVKASTTGNIYGIYDMSGGAWEYVMANFNNLIADSGFEAAWFSANTKYYDLYTQTTALNSYNDGLKGDALYETQGWYSDFAYFVTPSDPWLLRGGVQGLGPKSGIFTYIEYHGVGDNTYTFRLVQTE